MTQPKTNSTNKQATMAAISTYAVYSTTMLLFMLGMNEIAHLHLHLHDILRSPSSLSFSYQTKLDADSSESLYLASFIPLVNARTVPASEFLCPQPDMKNLKHECLYISEDECNKQGKDYIEHCGVCCRWDERPCLTGCKSYECNLQVDQFCGLTGNGIYLGSCMAGLYCQTTDYSDIVGLHTCQKLPELHKYVSSSTSYLPSLMDWGECGWYFQLTERAMFLNETSHMCQTIPMADDRCTPLSNETDFLSRHELLDLYEQFGVCGYGHYSPGVMRCNPASRRCEYLEPGAECGASIKQGELFATCSPGYECTGDFTLKPDEQTFKCTRKAKWGEACGFPGASCADTDGKAICFSSFLDEEIISEIPNEATYETSQMFIGKEGCESICGGAHKGVVLGQYYCLCDNGKGCGTDINFLKPGETTCPAPSKKVGSCMYEKEVLYAEQDWPCANGRCSPEYSIPLKCNASSTSPTQTCVSRDLGVLEYGKLNGIVDDFDYGSKCDFEARPGEPWYQDPIDCDCQCGPHGYGVCKGTHAPDVFSKRCQTLQSYLETCMADHRCTYKQVAIGKIPGCKECYSHFSEFMIDCVRTTLAPQDLYCIADMLGYDVVYKDSRIVSGVVGLVVSIIVATFALNSALKEFRARIAHTEAREANLRKIEEEIERNAQNERTSLLQGHGSS